MKRNTIVALLLSIIFSNIVVSQNKKDSTEYENPLDEVVVTGTRTEKTLQNTPILTKVISEKDIAQIGSVSAFDLLQNVMPGIQFSPDGHGTNMTIQGLDNEYVLVLIDGERLVGEIRGNVNLERISANEIKQVEIINGASSVLYGSNAIGGVINIITKKAQKKVEGSLSSRYSKFNTLNTNLNIGIKREKLRIRFNGFRKSSDGYDLTPETSSTYTANPYIDYSLGTKMGYQINKKIGLDIHATFFQHSIFNPPKSIYYTHRRNRNYTLGTKFNYNIGQKHNLCVKINSDKYNSFTVYEKRNDSISKKSDYQYTTFNIIDRYSPNKNLELVNGAELNLDKLYSKNIFGENIEEKNKNKHVYDINLFTQADWRITNRLELVGGVRYTYHSTYHSHFIPKLSAMYSVDRFKFRGTAALGYKSPSLKELYYDFDHRGMFFIIGNKDLKPENSRYFSISTEYTHGLFNISINAYHNMIENKIDMLQAKNTTKDKFTYQHYNIDKARIQGIETYIRWNFLKNFKLKTGYAFSNAIDESTGLQIYGNSKHTATTAFTFYTRHTQFPLSATITGRIASPRLYQVIEKDTKTGKETTTKEQTEAFSIWNFIYVQRLPIWKNINAELQFGINNIFDYSNIEKSSEINPGRTYWAGLTIRL